MLHCTRVGAAGPASVPKMYQITHYKDIYYQEKTSIAWRHRVSGLVSSSRISSETPVLAHCAEGPAEGVAPVPCWAGTVVLRIGPMILRFAGWEPAAGRFPPWPPSLDMAPCRGNEAVAPLPVFRAAGSSDERKRCWGQGPATGTPNQWARRGADDEGPRPLHVRW